LVLITRAGATAITCGRAAYQHSTMQHSSRKQHAAAELFRTCMINDQVAEVASSGLVLCKSDCAPNARQQSLLAFWSLSILVPLTMHQLGLAAP
jgi:hypothetical protein